MLLPSRTASQREEAVAGLNFPATGGATVFDDDGVLVQGKRHRWDRHGKVDAGTGRLPTAKRSAPLLSSGQMLFVMDNHLGIGKFEQLHARVCGLSGRDGFVAQIETNSTGAGLTHYAS